LDRGSKGKCDYCGTIDVSTIEAHLLGDLFYPLINLYEPIENFMFNFDMCNYSGEMIWDIINHKWNIFSDLVVDQSEKLLRDICANHDDLDMHFEGYVAIEDQYTGLEDEYSEYLITSWETFCDEVKFRNRYFVTESFDFHLLKQALSCLIDKSYHRKTLYRARQSKSNRAFTCKDLGKPPLGKATSGRANPPGIPYLYLATNPHTALAEIRPESDWTVGIGKFQLKKNTRLIDLSDLRIGSPFQHGELLKEYLTMFSILLNLGRELSRPVDQDHAGYDYVPSQYLCEFLKKQKYDGVIYRSRYHRGKNIALFNDPISKCLDTSMYVATAKGDRVRMKKWAPNTK